MSPFTKVKMSPYVEAESGQNLQHECQRDTQDRDHESAGEETDNANRGGQTAGDKRAASQADLEAIPGERPRGVDA